MRTLSFLALSAAFLTAACGGDDLVDRMEREHAGDAPIASPAAGARPATATTGSEVAYATVGDATVSGYLARPTDMEPTAGILVIHEWWGLNDNIRSMADRLAGEGYLALAVDLYEGRVAADRDTAADLMRSTQKRGAELKDNLRQAFRYLKQAGAQRVGVIGWCFGGGWSLRTALMLGDRLDATVIYYGRLEADRDELTKLGSPLLGIFGELDDGIPLASVREFEAALAALGKPAAIHVYPGADHAFANPSGTRYNEQAADDAWAKTRAFLAEHLAAPASPGAPHEAGDD
jgi:carboxymethylenebutenolidase